MREMQLPETDTTRESVRSLSVEEQPRHTVGDTKEQLKSPVTETGTEAEKLERWNKSPINIYRFSAALYSFVIMGMNDGAYGVSFECGNPS